MTDSYAVEIMGRLTRREAEALALELSELARKHRLRVSRLTVNPATLARTAQDPGAASGRRQPLEGGLSRREPEAHVHLGEESHGGGEVRGAVGTTEQSG
jgi:hypothetical protein